MTTLTTNPADWLSVAALCEALNAGSKHATFTEAAIRHYVKNAETNGLHDADAIRRINRKILISKSRFQGWIFNAPRKAAA